MPVAVDVTRQCVPYAYSRAGRQEPASPSDTEQCPIR
jgi:hypothetical protein